MLSGCGGVWKNSYVVSLTLLQLMIVNNETDRRINMFSTAVFNISIFFFPTGLSFVNPSSWWGIALKSQQTVTNTIAFIAAPVCRKTMKIT